MTKDGDLFSSAGLTVTSASTFNGSITLGAGDDLLLSTTSDITISGNTFTVAGATGNTLVAGTLDVTGVLTTTAAAVLGDGSTLAAATESGDGDRTIADKKYVEDTAASFGTWDTSTFTVGIAYQAATDGFVVARQSATSMTGLDGFTDSNADPTGTKVAETLNNHGGATQKSSIMFPVKKDDYWRVNSTGTSPTNFVYWLPVS